MIPATSGETGEAGADPCPNHERHADEVITVQGQLRLAEAVCQAIVDAGDGYGDAGGDETHAYREWCEERTTLFPPPDGEKFSMWRNKPIDGDCRALDGLRERIAVALKVPDAVWLGFGADTSYDIGVAKYWIKRSTQEWLDYRSLSTAGGPGAVS